MSMHAPLPPSSAARWAGQNCTGSVTLEARHELPATPEDAQTAVEGNAAHWVAAQMLRGHTWKAGMALSNGIIVDDEMIEAAELYVNDVRLNMPDVALWHIEEIERAPSIHPDNWGTPDLWAFKRAGAGGVLMIWDFKFGHRFVDAFENWQLLDYLACVLSREEFVGMDRRNIAVTLSVVQPRNYHPAGPIRRWSPDAVQIAQAFTRLEASAKEATGPNAATRVGPQCGDCKGRNACPALHDAADGVADIAGGTVSLELPPEALGVELKMLKRSKELLDARVTGLEAQATALLKAGKAVPFFGIGQTTAREQWTKPISEVIALGEMMGVKLAKEPTAITPKQARDAGMDAAIIQAYSERPPGALKLVPADTLQARKVFQK